MLHSYYFKSKKSTGEKGWSGKIKEYYYAIND